MLATRPDLSNVRNDIFKMIIGGVQSAKPVDSLAHQIVERISYSMLLIEDPRERTSYIRSIYSKIEGVDKMRRYNYVYQNHEKNQNVARVVKEVLFRFKVKYSRYF